jgi:hypothetical protein
MVLYDMTVHSKNKIVPFRYGEDVTIDTTKVESQSGYFHRSRYPYRY